MDRKKRIETIGSGKSTGSKASTNPVRRFRTAEKAETFLPSPESYLRRPRLAINF